MIKPIKKGENRSGEEEEISLIKKKEREERWIPCKSHQKLKALAESTG